MTLAFENVNYSYYADTLGRAVIPDEASFGAFSLEARLYVDGLYRDGLVAEREEGGFDAAACMITEELYKASLARNEGGAAIASESLGDYSYSVSQWSAKDIEDVLSRAQVKWLRLYCYVGLGVM